uniref:Heparanase n=1 Tax=Magallana gigas TaxID=29159 RepID=K1Q170_MAGGI
MNSTYVKENWKYFNLKSVKTQTLAAGLSPSYLRVGGTDADFVIFTGREVSTDENIRKFDPINFTMSETSWDSIHRFTQKVGWTLIFDLNSLYRTDGVWNSSNAEALIKYSIKKNYSMAGWELGNEPGEYLRKFGVHLTVQQLVKDYQKLSSILSQAPPNIRGRILIGPSTIPLVQSQVVQFFNEFLRLGGNAVVSSPNFHQKFTHGKQLWIGETSTAWNGGAKGLSDGYVAAFMWLDKLGLAAKNNVGAVIRQTFYGANYGLIDHVTMEPNPVEINKGNDATRKFTHGKQLWIGETSTAWNGGAKGLSDGYVAAFMWLDKLGLAAKNNVGAVIRQTFYGANYGLIDHVTMEPNPDYWLTYIYKKLVGDYVFQTDSSDRRRRVRFYAHCAAEGFPPGSLAVYGMNLYSSNVTLKLTGVLDTSQMKVYLMSAPNQNLQSKLAWMAMVRLMILMHLTGLNAESEP